jgi:membrane-associated phospholipid phosphatase
LHLDDDVRRLLLVLAPALALALAASVARAQPVPQTHRLHWDPAWSHAGQADWVVSALSLSVVTFELGVLQPIRPPVRWADSNPFDDGVRSALRLSSPGARGALEIASWAIWGTQMAYPVLVDVPYAWKRYGYGVARDLFWQDAVTLLVAGAVDGMLRDLTGRVRPDVWDCYQRNGESCFTSADATRSFPGGHLVNSAAAAGLVCTQHLAMRLYGPPWDAVACATTITASATVAVFRVLSDNHWATDQIAGLAIGGLIGWGIPYFMHLHGRRANAGRDLRAPSALVLPLPFVVDHGGGGGAFGVF